MSCVYIYSFLIAVTYGLQESDYIRNILDTNNTINNNHFGSLDLPESVLAFDCWSLAIAVVTFYTV